MAVPASSDSASGPWALALTSALDWAKDTPAPAQGPPEAPTSPTSKVCRKRRREEPVGHYDVLGITRTASNVEIRVAYRKGALQTHPDKGGDQEEFKKLVAAFEVLSDLKKRGDCSRDGLGARPQAEEEQARLMELDLISTALTEGNTNSTSLFASSLEVASSEVLQVLAKQLAPKSHKKQVPAEADEAFGDFEGPPRQVEAPEGLPTGWKCFEQTYKSGILKGKKYYRFESPWGAKGFTSVRAAVRADAEHHGHDGLEAARRWDAQKARAKPCAGAERVERVRTEQKSIYASHASNGVVRYFVQLSYSSFTIRTGRTLVLAKAIDWHIALTQTVAAASARLRNARGPSPMPLTTMELKQLLQLEPEISLSYRSAFSTKVGTLYSPTSRVLEMAVNMHHRFRTLVKRKNLSKESAKAFQVAALQEVSNHERSRVGLQRQLLKAVHSELRSRGFGLHEIKAMNLDNPVELEVAGTGRAEKPRGHQSLEEVKSTDMAAAKDLKVAMGLSAAGARRLAAQLRSLSTAELRRRVKILQSPSPVQLEQQAAERAQQRMRRAQLAPPALPSAPGPLALAAPDVPSVPSVPTMPSSELFGLPADCRGHLKSLNLTDMNSLRVICQAARNLVDFEVHHLAAGFTYKAELFDARLRYTRSGRVMGNGDAGRSQRCLGFLTRHAKVLQRLDVRQAPIDVLESKALRLAIPCMKHLTEIQLPTDGWSSQADRQRLVWALPRTVTVKFSSKEGSKEYRSPRKHKEEPMQHSDQDQLSLSATAKSEVLGLSQLIVGFRRIPEKKKRLLHGLLREAAMAGRIEPRKSLKWEWEVSDPQLQVVKELLTSAGVSLIRSLAL